jgi:hypothetical protein
MIPAIHKISTVLVLVIGVIHTAGTFFFYSDLSEAAVWFAGAGLCFIFVALINTALWSAGATVWSQRIAAAANFLFFFWLVTGVSATPALPQAIVAGIGATMVICVPLMIHREERKDSPHT